MRQLKYVNSKGDVIDFREYDTQIFQGNFHSYEWGYEGTVQQFGSTVERFTKDVANYEMIVAARGGAVAREASLNYITEVTEYDIVNNVQGKLYWGDYYLSCNIISAKVEPSESFCGAEKSMGIFAPYPFWICELKKQFYPGGNLQGSDMQLDYTYTYNYDYTPADGGNNIWKTGHYAASNFKMIIYGPCIDPKININGYPYEVFDTVEKGEYIVIENKNNKVVKYRNNGTIVDLWDYRAKLYSIFEKIPGGNLSVSWSGSFGFDIILYQERSEPKW